MHSSWVLLDVGTAGHRGRALCMVHYRATRLKQGDG
jgi:hypothetical protein